MKNIFPIVVDYSKSLAEMIKAGNYDWVNSDISKSHFPIKGRGKVELNIELIHYDKYMESDDIIRDLDSRALRPATLPELLAFSSTYPDKQHEFPIVALGSVRRDWRGYRYVTRLSRGGSGRQLLLHTWSGGWYSSCRFAAVRK